MENTPDVVNDKRGKEVRFTFKARVIILVNWESWYDSTGGMFDLQDI